MRGLVALASLSIDGHLSAFPPRTRDPAEAVAGFEQSVGVTLDAGHRRFLSFANGWPGLWPIGILGLAELRDRAGVARLTVYVQAAGDLDAAGLTAADVYQVAWARGGGTAVAVRPGRDRAGEVIWFEGVTTSIYDGFEMFFGAAAARLLAVAGPLVGGRDEAADPGELLLGRGEPVRSTARTTVRAPRFTSTGFVPRRYVPQVTSSASTSVIHG